MKNVFLAFVALMFAGSVYAGAANFSHTQVRGTGHSVTQSNGFSVVKEGAIGQRHLDSSTGGNTSVRNEQYIRGSKTTAAYNETSRGTFSTSGTVVDATRVGESTFNTSSRTRTTGTATSTTLKGEVGKFQAYESVGNSYSSERGLYVAASVDTSNTTYGSRQRARTYSTSAYSIYGAN